MHELEWLRVLVLAHRRLWRRPIPLAKWGVERGRERNSKRFGLLRFAHLVLIKDAQK